MTQKFRTKHDVNFISRPYLSSGRAYVVRRLSVRL